MQNLATTIDDSQKQNPPWTWRKVWMSTLLNPTSNTGKTILEEGNITLQKAMIWLASASFIYSLITGIPPFIKSPGSISVQSVLILLGSCLFSAVFSSSGIFILGGIIHIISKVFRSSGTLRNFFIMHVSFNASLLIIYGVLTFFWKVFDLKPFLWFSELILFYFLFVTGTTVIKSVYHFHWIASFFINAFAIILFWFGIILVFKP
jgi:hypothetical protein